ncbi:MAG TPA: TonB-dependent receptor [Terriglobales bacterium]|nr:TonB-dependent receptor [Terriglobales bacterium]
MRFRAILAVVLMLTLASYAFAQRLDGTLRGVVTDQSGAVVSGAKVRVTNPQTGVTNSTTTTSSGTYVFPNLLVGVYAVEVEAAGFQKYSRKDVNVQSNQVTEAHAKLAVGSEGTVVEVTSGSEVVQTTSSQLSNTFNERAVNEMPIASLGGSPLELAIMLPNTTTLIGGVAGDGGSVGGLRPHANGFSIDGADNNNINLTGSSAPVIQDAVSELNILTNQFSAEYGFAGGGQFNLISKSGTNNLHGELHWFNRNRNFNALDNIQDAAGLTRAPRNDYNRLGGSAGGPLVKNKLFVFGAYEYSTQGVETSGVQVLTPTAAGLTTLNAMAANSQVRDILAHFPAASTATGSEIVNGVAIPTGTFSIFSPNFFNNHGYQINADLNVGRHAWRGRYLYNRFRAPNFNLNLPLPEFAGTQFGNTKTIIVADAWTVSDRLVNDFRLSWNRNFSGFGVPATFANFPNAIIDTLGLDIGPQGNSPQNGGQNVYQLSDQMTYARGSHTWKWGAEVRKWIVPGNFLPRGRGEWDYANLQQLIRDEVPTGLNGALRGAGSGSFSGNQTGVFTFIQDDWKVTNRLTFNLGLRYEWVGNPRDVRVQTLNTISNLPGTPLQFNLPKDDVNNFGPRVGFAWDPTGSGKWAVRGGAGISYYMNFQNLPSISLPPQLQTEQSADITCSGQSGTPPAWCTSYNAGGTGAGFLAGGGLLQVNVPPTDQASARAATGSHIPDTVNPKVYSWSLGVQRELYKNTSIEARYIGTRSLQLPVQVRLNFINVFEANPNLTPLPVYFSASAIPATVAASATTQNDFINGQTLRYLNDGFFGAVTSFPAIGNSIYHGASIDFNQRMTKGLLLRTNYTWAHNIDNATNELFTSRVNPRRAQDGYNIGAERGRSSLDIRHKFALSWVYDLPKPAIDNGFAKVILHGWQFNGSWLMQSGQPITPLSGLDTNGDFDTAGDRAVINPGASGLAGTGVNYVIRNATTGATSVCNPNSALGCDPALTVGYVAVNPNARFIAADLGAIATAGRNSVSSPGLHVWNMAIFKNTKITEGTTLQWRVESFNTFNHRNFSLAAPTVFTVLDPANALSATYSNVSSPNFLNSKQFSGGSRSLQMALKFIF